MGVILQRRANIAVAKNLLHRCRIGFTFAESGPRSVTKCVKSNAFSFNPQFLKDRLQPELNDVRPLKLRHVVGNLLA